MSDTCCAVVGMRESHVYAEIHASLETRNGFAVALNHMLLLDLEKNFQFHAFAEAGSKSV